MDIALISWPFLLFFGFIIGSLSAALGLFLALCINRLLHS